MSKRRPLVRFLLLLLALCLPANPARSATVLPVGETAWAREVSVDRTIRVPAGSRLVIGPGTTVRVTSSEAQIEVSGVLEVRGSEEQPVVFASPAGWQGIRFVEAQKGSRLAGLRITGAEAAISSIATDFEVTGSTFADCGTAIKLLRESAPNIVGNRFENNDMAIDNEMRSAPAIRDNVFTGHRKTAILASHNSRGLITDNRFERNEQGIGLLQTYPDVVRDNVFVENRLALYCNQTKNTPKILRNRFERNEMAVVNFSFAYPAIEDNRFVDNKTAIRNDQYGSPLISHNLFRGNGTAIYNYRKSNPVVEYNRIDRSELALFCDYSSYPKVRNNHFSANRMAVELGIYQSADWERRSGSKPLMQKEATARNSRNTMLDQAPTRFDDRVDVSGNWWGDRTAALAAAAENDNLPFFHDRFDREWVTYEGFGPESYRIDRVVYRPWLDKPVDRVGPREVP